jgi:hypothetical protein
LATAVVKEMDIRVTLIRNIRAGEDIDAVERAYRAERGEFCHCETHVDRGVWRSRQA